MVAATYLLLGVGLASPSPASAQQQPSPQAGFLRELTDDQRPAAPGLERYQCFETELGWLFTNDTARVPQTVAALREAAAVFQTRFGVAVGRGAIVLLEKGQPGSELSGTAWTFNWPADTGSDADHANYLGTLRHEWGHELFGAAFDWQPRQTVDTYSSWAADWLDEAAGVLLEDSVGTSNRRRQLLAFYRRDRSGAEPKRIKPLETFFTMRHPLAPEQGGGDFMEELRRRLANDFMTAGAFYIQARGFIDFLHRRAIDPAVLGAIAANEAQGSNMIEWLRTSGPSYGLPATVAELEQEWQTWLAEGTKQAPVTPRQP